MHPSWGPETDTSPEKLTRQEPAQSGERGDYSRETLPGRGGRCQGRRRGGAQA